MAAKRKKPPHCVVCRTAVPDDEAHAVYLFDAANTRSRLLACAKHRNTVELTLTVGKAAVKAGARAAIESKAPGLLGRLEKALSTLRGE